MKSLSITLSICALVASAAHSVARAESVALYGLYNSAATDALYTTSRAERDSVRAAGYAFQGIVTNCESTQVTSSVPLYRLFKAAPETDHVYTASVEERGAFLARGYRDEGIACYVYPAARAGATPLYRLRLATGATIDAHWLTASERERAAKLAQGWIDEGIIAHVTGASTPVGLRDAGFANAVVKTAYESFSEGTTFNPITLLSPCLWDASVPVIIPGCPPQEGRTVYNTLTSNAFWQNGSWFARDYWVLGINNEPAFTRCNSGPPNLSQRRAAPGGGLFGFTASIDRAAGEDFPRAHLALDLSNTNPCFREVASDPSQAREGIPFLSIGAQFNRGNRGYVAALNPIAGAPSRAQFTLKLQDFRAPQRASDQTQPNGAPAFGPPTAASYFYAIAEWPNESGDMIPRLLFVTLFHWNIENCVRDASNALACAGVAEWNWPIAEEYYSPGADLAFIDAEDAAEFCNGAINVPRLTTAGQQIAYDVDLQQLFQCASDKGLFRHALPATPNLPVRGIHWANEATGKNGVLWTSVHGMRVR